MRAVAVAAVVAFGTVLAQPAVARDAPDSFADLVDKLLPTVVNITTTQNVPQQGPRLRDMPQLPPGSPFEELFKEFFDRKGGEQQQRRGTSLGSGFIIDGDGYIVTNNHVIQGAEDITVILRDDTQLKAKLIGSRQPGRPRRAQGRAAQQEAAAGRQVRRFGQEPGRRLGDRDRQSVRPRPFGDRRHHLGPRPRAVATRSTTTCRPTPPSTRATRAARCSMPTARSIGVNTAIYSPSGTNAGLAFSIPSNLVKQVAEQLREFGKVRRGWIGVSYQSVTDDIANSFGLDRARGVLVANVTADGPAAKAGVKRNDIILSFAGQEVPDLRRFPRIVANARVGSTVDIVVWRGGKETPLKLRIGEQEEPEKQNASAQGSAQEAARARPGVTSTIEQLGLTLQKVSDQLREKYGLSDNVKGVVVTKVVPNSPAAEKQLQAGDVILEVDQKPVTTPQEVTEIVAKLQAQKKRSVLLFVERQGDPRFAALRLTK